MKHKFLAYSLRIIIASFGVFLTIPNFSNLTEGYDQKFIVEESPPYGKPLEKWAQEYWQWWATMPPNIDDLVDVDDDPCITHQSESSKVLFLLNPYGRIYNSKCEISSQNALLVPLLVGECDTNLSTYAGPKEVNNANISSLTELHKCAMSSDETFNAWRVTLDGQIIFQNTGSPEDSDLKNRIQVRDSALFFINITQPEDMNFFEYPPGNYPAVVDGYYLFLKPLSPGTHVLQYFANQHITEGGLDDDVEGTAEYIFAVK